MVILGAGYAGLTTAVRLQRMLALNEAKVILINNNDYHYETTWLHEASAGTLHHERVRYPICDVVDRNKVQFMKDTVIAIKPDEKKVILAGGELTYHYLVVAVGGVPETFGIQGLKEHAFSITNVDSARQIREHIDYQLAMYRAEREKEEARLTIVVGGAGFTGIEFLGELVNQLPKLCIEYDIDYKKMRIVCVEAAPTVLPGFEEDLVAYAMATLEKKGVEFKLGTAIKECTPTGIIMTEDGDEAEELKAGTIVWAAGIRGNDIVECSGIETMRGRALVDSALRAPHYEEIFIIGDNAIIMNEESNRPYPPTAQIAMQQAEVCARNLVALIRNEEDLETFKPDLKGIVCSLGHDDAVAVVFGKKLTGLPASMMKKMVDNRALYLIGGASLVMKKGKFNLL